MKYQNKLLPLILLFLMLTLPACGENTSLNNPPPNNGNTPAEANVVKGRVTDMLGDPVPNATITISGYTGTGTNVVEEAITDAQGHYRKTVPSGLYDVDAQVELSFNGETYSLYLHPAEGSCGEEAFSADGIVRNFLFKVSGFKECPAGLDPSNYHSYSGGTVAVNYAHPQTLPDEAVATFTLTPQGPLADGSQGEVLSVTRTVQALKSFSGQPGTSLYLFDIPLGTYQITGTVTLPGGTIEPLQFGHYVNGGQASSFVFSFEAYAMWPYGIRLANISMYDANWTR